MWKWAVRMVNNEGKWHFTGVIYCYQYQCVPDKSKAVIIVSKSCSVVSDYIVHGILQARELEWSLSLLPGIFLTQGSNPGLPHCRQILCQLNHKGSPQILKWVAYPFSSGSWPMNCIAGGFFTNGTLRETQWSYDYTK